MKRKLRLAIFIARNLKTSTGSVDTALNLLEHLDSRKYRISIVSIDDLIPRSLRISRDEFSRDPAYRPLSLITKSKKVFRSYTLSRLLLSELKRLFDIAIVAIYNSFGEDGKLLGLLDVAGIPYVSPSLKTSALCLDKTLTKAVLRGNGIAIPDGFEVYRRDYRLSDINTRIKNQGLGYPVIVKAASCGASRGVSLVRVPRQLHSALHRAFVFSDEAVVEKFIRGKEFSVGVTGHYTKPHALPVVMIRTGRPFFDYMAKYTAGGAQEICPAPISRNLAIKLQETAVNAYRAVKADSHSRIDIIASDTRTVVLEINTFPGLTSGSIFPKELGAVGKSLGDFLDHMIAQKLNKESASDNF